MCVRALKKYRVTLWGKTIFIHRTFADIGVAAGISARHILSSYCPTESSLFEQLLQYTLLVFFCFYDVLSVEADRRPPHSCTSLL